MENLIIVFILVTTIGFAFTIFFVFKLLKEQRQTNENLTSNDKALTDIKVQLEKIESIENDHRLILGQGFNKIEQGFNKMEQGFNKMEQSFNKIENTLKETIKLD